jgi:ABC-type Fe3+/spermidine/putrescine transport system ATPase subunit
MATLTVQRVRKSYDGTTVLHPVDLTVRDGDFCCMLGSSGSGKTTLLRIIAGLAEPDAGRVRIGSRDVTDTAIEKRKVGFVFQNYALFPHLTVGANVAFGLRARGVKTQEIRRRCDEMLALVGLEDYGSRRPAQLSGGQQQRVALARALVTRPDVLLLDEPLSALDRKIRVEMQRELKRVHQETGLTTVMVTHDQEEAMNLGNEVLMLDSGHVQQYGAPQQLYREPANPFVARFLGAEPLGTGTIVASGSGKAVLVGGVPFRIDDGPEVGTTAEAVIKAESVSIGTAESATGRDRHRGRIRRLDFYGPIARFEVAVGDVVVPSIMLSHNVGTDVAVGTETDVSIAVGGVHAFAA